MWDPDKDEAEQFLQGLQKAGLKYGSADSAATEIELRRREVKPQFPAACESIEVLVS